MENTHMGLFVPGRNNGSMGGEIYPALDSAARSDEWNGNRPHPHVDETQKARVPVKSCLFNPPRLDGLTIHQWHLAVVGGDLSAALLLALLEKKHLKWLKNGMANGQDLWTPYSMEQIQKQLCGLYSDTTINRALEKLGESGFIKKSPVWALHKRVRYCLNIKALQHAVDGLLARGILK
jgi:hypothetical protein